MWALYKSVAMPTEDELNKLPIEHTLKEKTESVDEEKEAAKKMFPFMLRVIYPKLLIIKEGQ